MLKKFALLGISLALASPVLVASPADVGGKGAKAADTTTHKPAKQTKQTVKPAATKPHSTGGGAGGIPTQSAPKTQQ